MMLLSQYLDFNVIGFISMLLIPSWAFGFSCYNVKPSGVIHELYIHSFLLYVRLKLL